MLYIAKLTKDNKSFIKLGYTKHNTTDKRFKPYRDYFDKVELLEKLHYESDSTKEIITMSEDEFQEFEAFIKQQETEKYFDELEKEYKKDL